MRSARSRPVTSDRTTAMCPWRRCGSTPPGSQP